LGTFFKAARSTSDGKASSKAFNACNIHDEDNKDVVLIMRAADPFEFTEDAEPEKAETDIEDSQNRQQQPAPQAQFCDHSSHTVAPAWVCAKYGSCTGCGHIYKADEVKENKQQAQTVRRQIRIMSPAVNRTSTAEAETAATVSIPPVAALSLPQARDAWVQAGAAVKDAAARKAQSDRDDAAEEEIFCKRKCETQEAETAVHDHERALEAEVATKGIAWLLDNKAEFEAGCSRREELKGRHKAAREAQVATHSAKKRKKEKSASCRQEEEQAQAELDKRVAVLRGCVGDCVLQVSPGRLAQVAFMLATGKEA
jgi:hypothetical protein